MPSGGDYTRKRLIYQSISTGRNFAATDGNLTLVAGKAGHTLNIQKIYGTFSTSAAQAITFQDSTAVTPVYVVKIAASPGVDTRWEFDFGAMGKALTSGKDLVMAMTAGNAGHIEIEGYMTPDNGLTVV